MAQTNLNPNPEENPYFDPREYWKGFVDPLDGSNREYGLKRMKPISATEAVSAIKPSTPIKTTEVTKKPPQTPIMYEQANLFKNYRRNLGITAGLSALNDATRAIRAISLAKKNEDMPYPDVIKPVKFTPVAPRLKTAKDQYDDIDKGFVSALTLSRQLGRPELLSSILASREAARQKASTETGRQNLASITETSRTNVTGLLNAGQINANIAGQNIRNKMAYEQMMSGVLASNEAMTDRAITGIVDTSARYIENRMTADVIQKAYNDAVARGDMDAAMQIAAGYFNKT